MMNTPLQRAAVLGDLHEVERLPRARAEPTLRDDAGRQPWESGQARLGLSVLSLLLSGCPKPNPGTPVVPRAEVRSIDRMERLSCLDGDGQACRAWRQRVTDRIVASLQAGQLSDAGLQVRELCGLLDPELADLRCWAGRIDACSDEDLADACVHFESDAARCREVMPWGRPGELTMQEVPGFDGYPTLWGFDVFGLTAGPLVHDPGDGRWTWIEGPWCYTEHSTDGCRPVDPQLVDSPGLREQDGTREPRILRLRGQPGVVVPVFDAPPELLTLDNEVVPVPSRPFQEVTLDPRGEAEVILPAGMRDVTVGGQPLPNGPGPFVMQVRPGMGGGPTRSGLDAGARCRAGDVEGACDEVIHGLSGGRYLFEEEVGQLTPIVWVRPRISPPIIFEHLWTLGRVQRKNVDVLTERRYGLGGVWMPVGAPVKVAWNGMCGEGVVEGPGDVEISLSRCEGLRSHALATERGRIVGPVLGLSDVWGTTITGPADDLFEGRVLSDGDTLTKSLVGRWTNGSGWSYRFGEDGTWTGTRRVGSGEVETVQAETWPGGVFVGEADLFLGTPEQVWHLGCEGGAYPLQPASEAPPPVVAEATERDPAPAFEGVDLEGNRVRLDDLLVDGKWVVLSFWSSWCAPCKPQHTALLEAAEAHRDRASFVGVLFDDAAEDAERYLSRVGATYPHLIDRGGRISGSYGVQGVPETVFIAPDGGVVLRLTRPVTPEHFEDVFGSL